jgi:pimeloyl-ACP methyl ester carboxylesterase
VRSLQAYRVSARKSLNQWEPWKKVRCPILLVHGLQSDALLEPTIERMRKGKNLTLMHLPDTGHAPLLADRHQISFIRDWLMGDAQAVHEWSVLHAPQRERHPGTPVRLAPQSLLR